MFQSSTTAFVVQGDVVVVDQTDVLGCLGLNEEGDPMYTLARMSFDMFTPGDLVCSLQGVFNEVTEVSDLARSDLVIPKSLVDEARDRRTKLLTYTYVVSDTPPRAICVFFTHFFVCFPSSLSLSPTHLQHYHRLYH
jgi:hypothetical protein